MIDPDEIPLFSGSLNNLEGSANALQTIGVNISDASGAIHASVQALAGPYQAPETPVLPASRGPVRANGLELGRQVAAVEVILATFAEEIRPIAISLSELKSDAEQFVSCRRGDWREDEAAVEEHNTLIDDVSAKVVEKWEVERRCANAIEALFGGRQWVTDRVNENGEVMLRSRGGQEQRGEEDVYGYTSIPDGMAVLWGTPEEYDAPWYEDRWNALGGFLEGIVVDGFGTMIDGLTTLIPIRPIAGSLATWITGEENDGSTWADCGNGWVNLGLLLYAAVIPSWSTPMVEVNDVTGAGPDWVADLANAAHGAGAEFVKSFVAWDTWSEDPARAAGATTFNIATLVEPGFKGSGGGAKAGGLVDDAARLADDVVPPGASGLDDAARTAGRGMDDLLRYSKDELARYDRSVGEILQQVKGLDDPLGGVDDIAKKTDEPGPGASRSLGGDWRLGPKDLPTTGPVGEMLRGYQRYGGLTKSEFLAKYWNKAEDTFRYPPKDDGFAYRVRDDGTKVVDRVPYELRPGQIVDRFGNPRGQYLSPEGVPYARRGIPPSNLGLRPGEVAPTHNYYVYQVTKPFTVDAGRIAPWFGQPGDGIQYMLQNKHLPEGATSSVEWLLDNGYVRCVHPDSPDIPLPRDHASTSSWSWHGIGRGLAKVSRFNPPYVSPPEPPLDDAERRLE